MKLGQAFSPAKHPLRQELAFRVTPEPQQAIEAEGELAVAAIPALASPSSSSASPRTGAEAPPLRSHVPNALTLAGYGLGLWWSVGGPTWSGILSIVLDEVDGRVARAMNATSDMGSALDWTADVALVPMSLLRLGRSSGLGALPVLAAPPILYQQAATRIEGWRPPLGSWRALIMATAMGVEILKPRK